MEELEIKETTDTLIAKVEEPNKRKFLEQYGSFGCQITKTSEAIGMSKSIIHHWRKIDGDFAEAFDSLKRDLESELLEKHLNNINDIAFDPETPPQTRSMSSMFVIKAHDPRYKDKIVPDNYFSGDIVVQSSIPRPVIEGEYTEIKELDA